MFRQNMSQLNKNQNRKNYSSTLIKLLFLIQLFGLALVFIKKNELIDPKILGLFLAFIGASLISNIYLPRLMKVNNILILIVNMIYTIGLLEILRIDLKTGRNHIIWYLIGVFITFIVIFILEKGINLFKNKFFFYSGLTLFTFIVTIIFGSRLGGAKNWIQITDGITIQLSEFAKISFVFAIASFYGDYENISKFKYGKYYLNIATYIFIALFFLQGELGTAMVFFASFILAMFVFEDNKPLVLINIGLAFVGLFIAYKLFGHIRVRFEIWKDPWSDYNVKGYQIIQGLFAIASGAFFGQGIGLGSPGLVPVSTSDFILPVVIEEMGIFMGISIVLLFIILIYKGIKIALVDQDNFYSALAFSISVIFASQSLVMLGGVLKLIPLTGITTPFMSYGGSSAISSFILLAVLQFCSKEKKVRYE
ncbi:MAG: FtsW/RodA/SpoVE family cell cycle protein [Tissierellia bacterium]|nr:FtsW/RodA/SpoVE family cell cycle protein [Tissierellia bacterium]